MANPFDLDLQSVEVKQGDVQAGSGLICTPGCDEGTFESWCC
ncbi:lantibiotic, gallidermin/nisin family [Marininema mesophilum]|uniref:Lantibiotic n=1 Tax=Marininema mesophilum TaxID=1048340 RepID=A0A1H3AI33_9BACL|nr:gallidermin/nisin family lantibiotic [Marininema mesophilum]SDX29111.1 lantibiotic, gallidermin/nisin family [Marininema mesophilum]